MRRMASEICRRMDEMELGRLHRQSAWAAGLGIFLDGYDLSIIAVVLIFLRRQWHLTAFEVGLIGASALAGSLVGGLSGGLLADRFGRKAIYLTDICTFLLAALASGFSWNVASLIAFRFVLGVGIGADYPLSATYLAEFMPNGRRGSISVWVFALWMAGAAVSSAAGLAFMQFGDETWRLMLMSGALPALGVLWLRHNLPESPRWYLRRGLSEDAARVLAALDPSLSEEQCEEIVQQEQKVVTPRLTSWRVLFGPRWRRRTLFISIPWFLMDVMGYSVGIYAPMILLALGLKSRAGAIVGNTALLSVSIVGIAMLSFVIDRVGRLRPQIIGFLGDALGLALVGAATLLGDATIPVVFIGFIFWQISNVFGPANTTWIFPVELFPTDLRASAHGFATAFSRLGALLAVVFLPWIQSEIGTGGLLLTLASAGILGAVLSAHWGEETARIPLEQEADGHGPVDELISST